MLETLPISDNATLSRIYSSLKLPEHVNNKILTHTIDIVLVGRISPGKGQLDAIKACEVLKKQADAYPEMRENLVMFIEEISSDLKEVGINEELKEDNISDILNKVINKTEKKEEQLKNMRIEPYNLIASLIQLKIPMKDLEKLNDSLKSKKQLKDYFLKQFKKDLENVSGSNILNINKDSANINSLEEFKNFLNNLETKIDEEVDRRRYEIRVLTRDKIY
jgi:hypothetical protein